MKRQLSLKWNLTLSMTIIWIVVIGVLFTVLNTSFSSFDVDYYSLLERDTLSQSAGTATDIAFELAAVDKEGVVQKLKRKVAESPDIEAAGVLSPDGELIYLSDESKEIKAALSAGRTTEHGKTTEIGERMYGAWDITLEEGKALGRIILIRDIQRYTRMKSSSLALLIIAGFVGILFVTVASYLIGNRLVKPIRTLVAASERIADGDLKRIDIETSHFQELNRFGGSVKRMAEAMQTQVSAIKTLTSKIINISRETEGTMTNLASSAAQQAAAVNETAATVEEMEKAGQSSAVNAKHIVAAAEKTAEASKRGRQTVEKTYEIIMQIKDESHDISEKSKNLLNAVEEVGNIIQSVNSIAEQSKILAVNASIEAAKAGEFGSGFAVVAQEVKDLAQQSKDATLQITGTLTAIRAAIETMVATAQRGKERTAEGVNTIANAGAVMSDLSEAIRENSDFAKLIATNIQQQTIGLTQIAAAIEEINTTALENQSISRSIVHGTKQMGETFEELSEMVGRWRTPDSK